MEEANKLIFLKINIIYQLVIFKLN